MIFHHDPLTTPEDRTRLKWCLLAIATLALLIAGQGLALAADDAPPMHRERAERAYAVAGRTIASGRPAGCPPLWCGCYLAKRLGLDDRSLWLARNWPRDKRFRRIPRPVAGAIAVFARGKRGGHVGIVTAIPAPNRIVLLSGNDGGAVRERERSTAGIIAWLRYEGA